jgi:DNA-binding Lrp family transcriptional regulator
MALDLDKLDIDLLRLVQRNNQLTAHQLGERVGLSPSSALRRLHRMRGEGVIAYEAAVLSEAVTQIRVFAVVMVQMSRHSPEVVEGLRRELIEREEVQLVLEVSGGFDLVLLIVERSLAGLVAFTDRVLGASPYVQRFETNFVKNRLKATLALPLDGRDIARR